MRRPTGTLILIAVAVVFVSLVLRAGSGDAPQQTSTTLAEDAAAPTTEVPETTTTTTLPIGVEVCDLYGDITTSGHIVSPKLVEASGIAASRTTEGVLWSHNDSRGTATLYAFTTSGEDLGAFDVPDTFAFDWEDMSGGPGPDGRGDYLYIGDIGDNFAIRGGLVTVYRVPDIDPARLEDQFPETALFDYRYPDGAHNAEALFIDPVEPALYLVTKGNDAAFVFKGSLTPSATPHELALVATLPLGAEVSGADMSRDGTTLVLRGYQTVWMWHRGIETSVADMLEYAPCLAPSPRERQGEAITFDADFAYWTISEGSHSAIQVSERTR